MFKSVALIALFACAAVSGSVIGTHTIVEPALAKVGDVVHSYPTAVSHQSFTRIHNRAAVVDVVAPVVKTVEVAPVVEAVEVAPVVKAAEPIVKSVEVESADAPVEAVAPVEEVAPIEAAVKTVEVAPVEVAPAVKSVEVVAAAEPLPVAPIVQTYAAAPVLSHVYHAAPLLRTFSSPIVVAHSAPVVYSSPIVKTVGSNLIYTIQH